MPDPSTDAPEPLAGLTDPGYRPPPWPDGFDESAFRKHLDAVHAAHVGTKTLKRDRLRTWRDRYLREALDADRMAGRLGFLAELAVNARVPADCDDDALRLLVTEARRGVPRVATTPDAELDVPKHEPNPSSVASQTHPWMPAAYFMGPVPATATPVPSEP